jgi:hypothetical protein
MIPCHPRESGGRGLLFLFALFDLVGGSAAAGWPDHSMSPRRRGLNGHDELLPLLP